MAGGVRMAGLTAALAVVAFVAAPGTAVADPAPVPLPPPPAPAALPPLPGLTDLLAPGDVLVPATLLVPQNYRVPSAEQPSPYPLAEGVPPGPFATVDAWKGVHAMIHGALGRLPGADLGQALPGTAPPPGTALPPGLEQYLPVPVAPPTPQPGPVIYPPVFAPPA